MLVSTLIEALNDFFEWKVDIVIKFTKAIFVFLRAFYGHLKFNLTLNTY
jgi:hypothetical protein